MKEYILHRCLLMIPTVLGVSLIVFLMMHFIPGDPISILMGDYYTPEAATTIWFALAWRVLPAVGYVPLSESILGNFSRMILPAVTLGLPRAALLTHLIRASMLEVIRLEYVTTARAKGVRERSVVLQHALKNTLIPAVTVMGIQIGFLMGGAIVGETVFSVPGFGSFGIAAISLRDDPQVQAFVLLVSLAFVFSNLAVDILYGFLDPRIRYGKEVD